MPPSPSCLQYQAKAQEKKFAFIKKQLKNHLEMGFLDPATERDDDSSSVHLLTFIEQHIVYFT